MFILFSFLLQILSFVSWQKVWLSGAARPDGKDLEGFRAAAAPCYRKVKSETQNFDNKKWKFNSYNLLNYFLKSIKKEENRESKFKNKRLFILFVKLGGDFSRM
jgi:hypothetical protein